MKFKLFLLAFMVSSLPFNALAETPRPIFASSIYNGAGSLIVPTTTPFGNRACYFDANSAPASSATTKDELAFLHGVTSNIQDQINSIIVGGGGIQPHGTAASPISIVSSAGIVPANVPDQVWWITPSTGSGAVNITSTPQISAGSTVGQRLTLFGVTSGGAYFQIIDGNGVLQNGPFDMITGQAIVYMWNGTVWQFISNAI